MLWVPQFGLSVAAKAGLVIVCVIICSVLLELNVGSCSDPRRLCWRCDVVVPRSDVQQRCKMLTMYGPLAAETRTRAIVSDVASNTSAQRTLRGRTVEEVEVEVEVAVDPQVEPEAAR